MMGKKENKKEKKIKIQEGYRPLRKGYQPSQSTFDLSKPPQGGTGVPLSGEESSSENSGTESSDPSSNQSGD